MEEDVQPRGAEGGCGLGERVVDRRERTVESEDEERHGDEGLCEHDCDRRERDAQPEPQLEVLPSDTGAAVREEERDPSDDGRQDDRDGDERAQEPAPREVCPREDERQRHAEHDGDGGRCRRGAEREEQRRPRQRVGEDARERGPRSTHDEGCERQDEKGHPEGGRYPQDDGKPSLDARAGRPTAAAACWRDGMRALVGGRGGHGTPKPASMRMPLPTGPRTRSTKSAADGEASASATIG